MTIKTNGLFPTSACKKCEEMVPPNGIQMVQFYSTIFIQVLKMSFLSPLSSANRYII